MMNAGFGDLAQAGLLRRQTTALKVEVQRLSSEVATGRAADTARALSGDLGQLAGIETSLRRLTAYRSATTEAALQATGQQGALAVLDRLASDGAQDLITAGTVGQTVLLTTAVTQAGDRFSSAVAALNTRQGDRALFAGTAPQAQALAGADAILDALEAEIAGIATAEGIAAAVGDWFTRPSGFDAVAYSGGAAPGALPMSPEDAVRLDVTATDPAVKATLEGLALAALLNRPTAPADATTRTALARIAGEKLLDDRTGRSALAARIGLAEARIETAAQRNATEASALEQMRAGLLAADPYAAATALEAAQTQLETLFAVTARLSRLSLADYL